MPTFGDFETFGEPLAITEDRGHVSTVWRARKVGTSGDPAFALKYYVPHRRTPVPGRPEDALENDPAQKFLAGIKQFQKTHREGGRNLAPIHDFGFAVEGVWYATDFYPRNTLKAWIARRGGVDSAALRQVVHSLVAGCLALKSARGFSHGNLKPANVFLVGKPRPLRGTPLHLADAYPAAPLQLARDERRGGEDLPAPELEKRDLRALGELLLQLVEGRLVTSAYDYNYPVATSTAWTNLGGEGERWRELCNRLLDPQLSLEKVNLELLAKDYRPSGVNAKIPVIVVATAIICLVVAGFFWNRSKPTVIKPADPSNVAFAPTNQPPVVPPVVTPAAIPPTIAASPSDQTVTEGEAAKFTVVANGTVPLSYQWQRDDANLSGETGSTLTLSKVTMSQSGSYTVVVSNAVGVVTSRAARLTVSVRSLAPAITTSPSDQAVTEGDVAKFTIVASGTEPLSYQWKRNDLNVSGETGATLTLSRVTTDQAGSYTVVVSNAVGLVTSRAAQLTVSARSTAPAITASPSDQTVTEGDAAKFAIVASGTGPLSYQWKRNDLNVSGETGATLTLSRVTTNQAGSYTVVVSNAVGLVTSRAAQLNVSARSTAPAITTSPSDQTVTEGDSTKFIVVASGTAPLSYQWKRNDLNMAGESGATLTLSRVTANQAGSYTVLVSNTVGLVTSSAARLTVSVRPMAPTITGSPSDQAVTEGEAAKFTVGASGTAPLSYQWKRDDSNLSGETGSTLTLSKVTTNQAGTYTVVVSNAVGLVASSAARLTVSVRSVAPTITASPSDRAVTEGEAAKFTVLANGTAPLSYQWKRDDANLSGETGFTLTLSKVTTNQAGTYTVVVSNAVGLVTSSAARLTVSVRPVAPTITASPSDQAVTEGEAAKFTVLANGTAPLSYQWKRDDANLSGETGSTLTLNKVTMSQAGSYTVIVSNAVGLVSSSGARLTVKVRPVAPTITSPPLDQTVTEGDDTKLTVLASGTAPLSYQWKRDDANLSGETGSLLTLNKVTMSQAGSYSVVVSNAVGLVTSSAARLTVKLRAVAPTITASPSDQTVTEGDDTKFAVVASGTAPLSYQWKRNDLNVIGATGSTLTLNKVTASQAGNYAVVVSNLAGLVTSSAVKLSVIPPPMASSQQVQVDAGKPVNITLQGSGPTGVTLIYKLATKPSRGQIGDPSGSAVVYTTDKNASGQDSFTFVVSDGKHESTAATVAINIKNELVDTLAAAELAFKNGDYGDAERNLQKVFGFDSGNEKAKALQGQVAAAKQARAQRTELDNQLEDLRKQLLGGKKPQWLTVPESTKKKIETDFDTTGFKTQIKELEKKYASLMDKVRTDLIKALKENLDNR